MSDLQFNNQTTEINFKHHFKPGERRRLWLSRVAVWFFCFLAVYPIIYIVGNSLSSSNSSKYRDISKGYDLGQL